MANTTRPTVPAISRTEAGGWRLSPSPNWIRYRPKTQPHIIMASHGTTGYLTIIESPPYTATRNAAGMEDEPGGCQTQAVRTSPTANQPRPSATSAQLGSLRRGAMHIIARPIARSTWNVQRPEPSETRVGSSRAMIAPRVSICLSISQAFAPFATFRSTLNASAVPARNTNVGG